MRKTRDLFKKIRDTKGTFHAKMGTIKDKNGMDVTEAEGIKKKWQEYTEELNRKDLHDPDNHNNKQPEHRQSCKTDLYMLLTMTGQEARGQVESIL